MNWTLVTSLIRQRFTSPVRVVLLLAGFLFPLLFTTFVPGAGLQLLGTSLNFVLVLGAGAVGQDLSSGVLQLLFARPVRRREYVVSRWLAVGGGAAAIFTMQALLAILALSQRDVAPEARACAILIGENVLLAFGVAGVIVFFSTLAGGFSDLAFYLLTTVLGQITAFAGQVQNWPLLARAGEEVQRFVSPHIDFVDVFGRGGPSWFAIVSYFSTIAICLLGAIVVMNRRELSYASS